MKKDKSNLTMLTISTGFLIIYVIFSWKWVLAASLIIGLTGIVSPYLSSKIEWAWMKIATILGYVVPNILLSLVFFLVLFPISFIYKIFNKDPLMLSNKYNSFFIDINKEVDKKSFEKTW